jgi:HD-GYP domain-containing protein (c-di-GMP phosphodiesterase class II)
MAVADVFTAVAEDRPYRKGLQRKEIEKILTNQATKNFLDMRIVNLLLDNFDEIWVNVMERQAIAREYFQNQLTEIENKVSA